MRHDIHVCIGFFEDLGDTKMSDEQREVLFTTLGRLQYVRNVTIGHTCYVEAELHTSDFAIAKARTDILKRKMHGAIERCMRAKRAKA